MRGIDENWKTVSVWWCSLRGLVPRVFVDRAKLHVRQAWISNHQAAKRLGHARQRCLGATKE